MDSPILKSIIDVVVEDFGFVVVKDQNDKIIYPIESARLNQIKLLTPLINIKNKLKNSYYSSISPIKNMKNK